jgi:hypothetical protein
MQHERAIVGSLQIGEQRIGYHELRGAASTSGGYWVRYLVAPTVRAALVSPITSGEGEGDPNVIDGERMTAERTFRLGLRGDSPALLCSGAGSLDGIGAGLSHEPQRKRPRRLDTIHEPA